VRSHTINFLLVALVSLAAVAPAAASTNGVMNAYLGASGAWFANADPSQGDLELTGNLSASLSPHISAVGGMAWGTCNSYLRGSAGGRITVTDANNPDFSIGVGAQYRVASKEELRPNEWATDVSIGYRPFPVDWPRLTLVGQGWYGFTTQKAGAQVGARWRFPL
jgi:hypothetical protein